MCDRCANIDYKIGDVIWLPCGGSPSRYRQKPSQRPMETPRGGWSEEDEGLQVQNRQLIAHIRKQREEIARLKAQLEPKTSTFEGVS